MCVIIYKPAGVDKPAADIIDAAHVCNPDGCGVCTPTLSYKGLSYRNFLKAMNFADSEEPMLIHFRYATHGSVRKGNCHPFYDEATGTFFMHNGVLDIEPKGDRTDSQTAFDRILKPVLAYGLDSTKLYRAVAGIIGYSRFAFMQGDQVRLFGQFREMDGCYYSNLRFLSYLNNAWNVRF